MYKFYGTPLQEIKSKNSGKTLFRFDTKGEFITDDEEIINRALGHFDYLQLKSEEVGEKVKKTVVQTPLTITTNDKKCKKCNFTCDNQVELMQHYRKEHPKE